MILDPTMEARPDDPEFALRLAHAEPRLALYVRLRLGAGLARELEVEDLVQDVFVAAWGAFPFLPQDGGAFRSGFEVAAHSLFWIAAVVTLITGAQYWNQTRKALAGV